MNQYLTYFAIGVGILVLLLVIPGVKVLAEMVLKGGTTVAVEVFKHKGTFLIWFIKTLSSDHMRVMQHAFKSRDELDPTQKIRRAANGYDN